MRKIVKFEKEDCNPCLMVSRFLEDKNIAFETVNPFNSPELAMKHKIRSVPTTILVDGSEELVRIVGYDPEKLNTMVAQL
ncbi:thioredoxin 1 [Porphyromonadaceae bacterium NLAE-zl-C104]|uniref:thioredoxin family protein n=1 Tax=Proteiniphilum TaxID=294702 RepID=UPI0008980636|nr:MULTISPECIES: thioredoxin family protein [Proteiniphilum]MDY9918878.1 thioredoxin family protein [Proteiniphilum sp.]SEA21728.1 thioredoxin 1 [Porphyromonadaceae bacterium KH3R12]SFS49899.1 thioredoxin 1 [Porphyromonadaceae bacterium NLAE-zl-C104]